MSVMIDGLKLKVPFRLPSEGATFYNEKSFDVLGNPVPVIMASVDIEKNGYTVYLENLGVNYWQQMKGDTEVFESMHKFESLPSNYSGLAFKIVLDPQCPCIWMFASPAKIMQGFNVYGSDNLEECSISMFNVLNLNYPLLCSYLDIAKSQIQHIDVTASTRVNNESELKQVLDYVGNIQTGQTKQNNKNYQFTKYWGSEKSERKQLKIYAKSQEIDASLKNYKKKLPEKRFKQIAQAHTPDVRAFAKNLLRFEARLKKKLIKEFGLPVLLKDLIKLQKKNNEIMKHLWIRGFDDIMQALKGQNIKIHNDEEVLKNLKMAYRKITPTGKESYATALKLYGFYKSIKSQGYEAVKCSYPPSSSTFHRLKNDLLSGAGLSLGFLQNLHDDSGCKIISFVKYFEIDFDNQVPDGWIAPTADNVTYINSFN